MVCLRSQQGDGSLPAVVRGSNSPGSCAPRVATLLAHALLPCAGVKNREQAEAVAGVLGWRLSESEVQALDNCSSVLQLDDMGAPFEQW